MVDSLKPAIHDILAFSLFQYLLQFPSIYLTDITLKIIVNKNNSAKSFFNFNRRNGRKSIN